MYVRPGTTEKEIRREIKAIEEELRENKHLSDIDRIVLHDELDYLESFLPQETW